MTFDYDEMVKLASRMMIIADYHADIIAPDNSAALYRASEIFHAIAIETRQGGDVQQAPTESPQSGPKGNAQ